MTMNLGGTIRINKCGLLFIAAVGFLIIFYAYSGGSGTNVDSNGLSVSDSSPSSATTTDKVSLRELICAAVDVATRGGLEVVQVRKSTAELEEKVKGKTKEGVKDSATAGDFRSHRVMYYSLKKTFPKVKVISEEHDPSTSFANVPLASTTNAEVHKFMKTDEIVNAEDVTIWIDPLDATKEYTENLLEYVTTMVGVAVNGEPKLGVVHRPFQNETYWAVVGHGHSPNLKHFDDVTTEKKSADETPFRIIVSRSHKGDVKEKVASVLGASVPLQLIEAAGAGYKVLQVINQDADVYLHVTAIKKWDLCAGHALLKAMGGKMTTIEGDSLDYSGHTEPLNSMGIIGYVYDTEQMKKLRRIKISE